MKRQTDILLVEDNPCDAELTIRALRKNNIANEIVHVSDGEAALEFLGGKGPWAASSGGAHQNPKVVLLDLKMPKVDGVEVLRKIRSDPVTQFLPVVVLTSSREDRDVVESYKLGANSYIVKPVDFEKFTEAVRSLGLYWLLLNEAPVFRREPSPEDAA